MRLNLPRSSAQPVGAHFTESGKRGASSPPPAPSPHLHPRKLCHQPPRPLQRSTPSPPSWLGAAFGPRRCADRHNCVVSASKMCCRQLVHRQAYVSVRKLDRRSALVCLRFKKQCERLGARRREEKMSCVVVSGRWSYRACSNGRLVGSARTSAGFRYLCHDSPLGPLKS